MRQLPEEMAVPVDFAQAKAVERIPGFGVLHGKCITG